MKPKMRNRLKWQLREYNRKRCLQKPFQIFFKTEGETQNFDKRLKNSRKTQGFGKSATCRKSGEKKSVLRQVKDFTVVNMVVSTNLAKKSIY